MVPAGSAHLRMEAESSPVNFLYAAAIVLATEVQERPVCACGMGVGDGQGVSQSRPLIGHAGLAGFEFWLTDGQGMDDG